MYTNTGFVIGFHGCCETVRNEIVNNPKLHLSQSDNKWDWLGKGIYFWENSYERALSWAQQAKKFPNPTSKKPQIITPSVIGAIIDLGDCLDLFEEKNLNKTKLAYDSVSMNPDLPINISAHKNDKDKVKRFRDHYVIETVMSWRSFDTVRSPFFEGKPLYKGAGFRDKTHIQICVRNTDNIKGYFIPII